MNLNEPNASLRTVSMRLTNGGAGLAAGHVWNAGDVKLVKPDGSIANAATNPVFIVGAANGSWDWIASQAEIATLRGNYRLQITSGGVDFHEEIFRVDLPGGLEIIIEGPDQYDGNGEPVPVGHVAAEYNVTVIGALRELLGFAAGPANNLDGIQGNPAFLSRVGGRTRIAAILNNGNRSISSRDDT